MTPTEAAALATVYAVPVGFFIYKGLNGREFLKVLVWSPPPPRGSSWSCLYSVMNLSRLYIMEDLPGGVAGPAAIRHEQQGGISSW